MTIMAASNWPGALSKALNWTVCRSQNISWTISRDLIRPIRIRREHFICRSVRSIRQLNHRAIKFELPGAKVTRRHIHLSSRPGSALGGNAKRNYFDLMVDHDQPPEIQHAMPAKDRIFVMNMITDRYRIISSNILFAALALCLFNSGCANHAPQRTNAPLAPVAALNSSGGLSDAEIRDVVERVTRHQLQPLNDGEYPTATNLAAAQAAKPPEGIA